MHEESCFLFVLVSLKEVIYLFFTFITLMDFVLWLIEADWSWWLHGGDVI